MGPFHIHRKEPDNMNEQAPTLRKPKQALEISPFASDGGERIGRDPRQMPEAAWSGFQRLTAMQAIRAKCLDCCYSAAEVRKCVQADCPLWPLRMGSYPKGLKAA